MKIARLTERGRLQIPPEIRRRWGTRRIVIEDHGEYIDLRPVFDDPLSDDRGGPPPLTGFPTPRR